MKKENRGMIILSNNTKQNIKHKTDIQSEHDSENSTQAAIRRGTGSLRRKRNTEGSSGDKDVGDVPPKLPSHRRRVRVKVPINKNKVHNNRSVNNEEILTLSEAQHAARIPDMDIGEKHNDKHGQVKIFPQPEYGSRMVKTIHAPVNLSSNDERNDHQKRRVVVTRRKKPEHSTADSVLEDTLISKAILAISTTNTVEDDLVITTYRPKEIPFFFSSNIVVDDKDLYLLPTTVRGNKVNMNTSGQRRVLVTKKRPISVAPTQRRRIVVTKKRPVSKLEIYTEPTDIITDSMSTVHSYKYTVLNTDEGLGSESGNMVKVSQVSVSQQVKQENYNETASTENGKKNSYNEEMMSPSETYARVEKSNTEQGSSVLISTPGIYQGWGSIPSGDLPVSEVATHKRIPIQSSQIEPSFHISTYDPEYETPTFRDSTQHLPLKISTITLADSETTKPSDSTSVQKPENDYESSLRETEHDIEGNKKHKLEKEKEDNEEDQKRDRNTMALDEFTTESQNINEDSLISLTEGSSSDGPRFIRPTRFSITRRPGRTKITFPGRRRTSVSTPSSTTGSHNIFSSSGNYKSSYKGRRPSTTSRTFGRSSKPHIHLYTTPATSVFTETTASQFEEIPSYGLSNSSSNILSDGTSIKFHTNTETSSENLPSLLLVTPVLATTSSSPGPDFSSTVVMETVTSTRLRTYTYIVTRVAGQEQVVTSTTEVKPHVTTFTVTKTLPILATGESFSSSLSLFSSLTPLIHSSYHLSHPLPGSTCFVFFIFSC
jgi:hypothetical protein